MNDDALSNIDPVDLALRRTPARVFAGRAGPAYRTATALKLREDHAAARDAVHTECNLIRDFGSERIAALGLFEAQTQAASKREYLLRPDLGRKLTEASRETIRLKCPTGVDLQIVIGDGLSAAAVAAQAPGLLDRLAAICGKRGWSVGQTFFVRYCRVGILNEVGEILQPKASVLLIGERPGLATAQSLSAYMAYRPHAGQTDADRNLISNIHGLGVGLDEAGRRIVALVERFTAAGRSGVGITETSRMLPIG